MVYSSVLSQLNHKIKSSWVKHSWFYSNHKNHEDISPLKFPAIRYDTVLPGCCLKKIHRVNKDLMICVAEDSSPCLPSDIELEDSPLLWLLLHC